MNTGRAADPKPLTSIYGPSVFVRAVCPVKNAMLQKTSIAQKNREFCCTRWAMSTFRSPNQVAQSFQFPSSNCLVLHLNSFYTSLKHIPLRNYTKGILLISVLRTQSGVVRARGHGGTLPPRKGVLDLISLRISHL